MLGFCVQKSFLFVPHRLQRRPLFPWLGALGWGSREAGPPPLSGSQAGPYLAASWQTWQNHPARRQEKRPVQERTHEGIRKKPNSRKNIHSARNNKPQPNAYFWPGLPWKRCFNLNGILPGKIKANIIHILHITYSNMIILFNHYLIIW